ncbi:type 1 fimbrial protein [Salmonella enterica]|nr:type 1 fimbrial protein [Salmonella enterica]
MMGTRMNFSKKMILAGVLAFAVSESQADTNGSLTFAGSVIASACTVEGLNESIDFGAVDIAKLKGLSRWDTMLASVDKTMVFSGCAGVSKIKITPSFVSRPKHPYAVLVNGDGSGVDILGYIEPKKGVNIINTGKSFERVIADGGNELPLNFKLYGAADGSYANAVAGKFKGEMSFLIDYQ